MVGKKKGSRKSGGRTKGSPNKKTVALSELADTLGCNPFEILLRFAMGDWEGLGYERQTETRYTKTGETFEVDVISADLRAMSAKEACKYLYPQRKAVEVSNSDDQGFKIIVEDYTRKK